MVLALLHEALVFYIDPRQLVYRQDMQQNPQSTGKKP